MPEVVYTIGHSTHSADRFIEMLAEQGVTALADVRSHPRSRFNPQFNQKPLRAELKKAGIAYVFLGRELGARPQGLDCYINGQVCYDRLAGMPIFDEGLRRIARGAKRFRIALMCAEKDPLTCHRAILVSRHLVERGIGVRHILEDGRIESHEEVLSRLLSELGLDENDLFRCRDELILDAYDQRGKEIAYKANGSSEEFVGESQG